MSESRADLRACPFCGDGNARLEEGDYGQMVSCHPRSGCGAVTGYYETETEAAKAWNRRALADTQNPEPQLALNKRYAEGFFQGYEQAKRDYLIESTAKAVLRPAIQDRADAERYRWLREGPNTAFPFKTLPSPPWASRQEVRYGMPTTVACLGETLDAAIDAAMKDRP